MSPVSFTADANGLSLRTDNPLPHPALSLAVGGRTVWSFRTPSAFRTAESDSEAFIPWPPDLAARLTGWARLSLVSGGGELTDERIVVFTDSGIQLTLQDPLTGQPLVVNKWQRISKSFEGKDPSLIDDLLDRCAELIVNVEHHAGLSLFVTGGTLLGPVRDGRILPNDDDADLAYLSAFDNPSDVALESFSLERALLADGYEVIRLSAGHLQVMFPGASLTDDFYIDIFAYFVCGGWFYGTFHAREPANRVPILPLQQMRVGAHVLPAPSDPPALLAAIYGQAWRTPDPAFTFDTPPAALRRYRGWLSDVNMDRENWEQHHRDTIASGKVTGASDFARLTAGRIAFASQIVELGCGFGSDSQLFASAGHRVLAVDYSRPAIIHARSQSTPGAGTEFRRANLSNLRDALRLAADCSGVDLPTHVYARSFFDAVHSTATDIALRLIHGVLNDPRSRAHVEFAVGDRQCPPGWTERHAVSMPDFSRALKRCGLMVEEQVSVADRGSRTELLWMTLKGERT